MLLPPPEPEPDRYHEAAVYWGEVVNRQLGRKPSTGPGRSTKLGRALAAAVKRDPDQVLDALRFVAESDTERAQRLREYTGLTMQTVLRHLDEYAELWRANAHRPKAGRPLTTRDVFGLEEPDATPRTLVEPWWPEVVRRAEDGTPIEVVARPVVGQDEASASNS